MKNVRLRFVLSATVGIGLLYYTIKQFETTKAIGLIQQANIHYFIIAFLLLIVAYLLRGKRWLIWEKDLSYLDSLKLIFIGFMGNNILPARLGEMLRAHCTADKTNSEFGRTAALASVTIERILDGLILACVALEGLLLVEVDKGLFGALISVALLFFILSLAFIISTHFDKRVRNLFEYLHNIFPGHLTRFGKEKISYFLDGLLLLGSIKQMIQALIFTIFIWSIEVFSCYFIANAIFDGFPLKTCLIFLAAVNFTSLFPFTIGGIGAIEAAASAFLVSGGIPPNPSLAMVLVQHLMQFSLTTAPGIFIYFSGKYYLIPIIQDQKTGAKPSISRKHDIQVIEETSENLAKLLLALGIESPTKEDVYLSIVIPAYNEKSRLPRTVLETIKWCNGNYPYYEIIVVDDGSSDDTLEIAKLFSDQVRNVKAIACPHLGKGAAVRMGMLNASGKYVLFMDADGATPLDEIPKLISRIQEGYPIAIGSRIIMEPEATHVEARAHRKIIGRIFAAFVNIFAIRGIGDTQCGFKMFKNDVAYELFSRQKLNGFAFDVEVLHLSKCLSFPVAELSVNWVHQEGSKINLVTDSAKMLWDIMRIKWLHKGITSEASERLPVRSKT